MKINDAVNWKCPTGVFFNMENPQSDSGKTVNRIVFLGYDCHSITKCNDPTSIIQRSACLWLLMAILSIVYALKNPIMSLFKSEHLNY